ncbi:MAG: hypothetical protein HGB10_00395 [Coriobacteriia bacterium]|nr:hypothetical protein [Coriobacteriia bacterium]
MSSRPARTVITIIMNLVIAAAIALTARLAVEFFGQLSAKSWGEAIIAITDPLVIPFGLKDIKTPYGGVFDVNAALMVCGLLVGEWVLAGIRDRA